MNDIGNWGGGGAQDFWPTHTSSMPIWILSAESPRSRDISSSTNYFSFSFIYFILLSKQYRFLILSTALQSQMPTHYQQLPHSCDIALFLNRKFINILGEGKKGRKKKKSWGIRHSLHIIVDARCSQFLNQVPTHRQHLGWVGEEHHLGAFILLSVFWAFKQHFWIVSWLFSCRP